MYRSHNPSWRASSLQSEHRIYNSLMSSDMQLGIVTDPTLMGVLAELKEREPIFHRTELGTAREDLERMTVDDFWEIGASGRRYGREYVLGELEKRYAGEYLDVWETSDFHCRKLGENVFLLTYTLFQGGRKTRRATIWQQTDTGWKIVFHQGTIVQSS